MGILQCCPFCGAMPIYLEVQPAYNDTTAYVHCMKCDSTGPIAANTEDAGKLWNENKRKELV